MQKGLETDEGTPEGSPRSLPASQALQFLKGEPELRPDSPAPVRALGLSQGERARAMPGAEPTLPLIVPGPASSTPLCGNLEGKLRAERAASQASGTSCHFPGSHLHQPSPATQAGWQDTERPQTFPSGWRRRKDTQATASKAGGPGTTSAAPEKSFPDAAAQGLWRAGRSSSAGHELPGCKSSGAPVLSACKGATRHPFAAETIRPSLLSPTRAFEKPT